MPPKYYCDDNTFLSGVHMSMHDSPRLKVVNIELHNIFTSDIITTTVDKLQDSCK